ncbi:MAG: hypothetical protein ABJB66_10890 [Gemmatimonadaceae bacterium]
MKGISRAALTVAAIALTTTSAAAITGFAASFNVEAEKTPQGASLSFTGKGYDPNAVVMFTGSRAPGAREKQDFGKTKADDKGVFKYHKVAACTLRAADSSGVDPVNITATDSATGKGITKRVEGGAWQCP